MIDPFLRYSIKPVDNKPEQSQTYQKLFTFVLIDLNAEILMQNTELLLAT